MIFKLNIKEHKKKPLVCERKLKAMPKVKRTLTVSTSVIILHIIIRNCNTFT